MITLPSDRRVINGRTHSRSWDASDFDPIQGAYRRRGNGRIRGALLACAIGVALAAVVFWGARI